MEKSGIVYLMKTVIKGVYKIGISDVSNFEGRMRHLENNGYANVAGLERILAVKTDNYKEKENLLHEIFSKSRIGDTELFAVDENLVKRLFLSLRGEIVFPKNETAESEFEKASTNAGRKGMPDPAANNCLIWYGADTGNTLTRCLGFWRVRRPTSRKNRKSAFLKKHISAKAARG